MVKRTLLLLGVLAVGGVLAACGTASSLTVPGLPDTTTLGSGAMTALRARWPRVELGSSRSATCPSTGGAPPAAVAGDFNGDGTRDVVLWITTDGTPRLAALIARLNGEYLAYDLGDTAASTLGTLEVGPRGTSYRRADLAIDVYYGLDTVVLRGCDGARTAYFWTGDGFAPAPLAG